MWRIERTGANQGSTIQVWARNNLNRTPKMDNHKQADKQAHAPSDRTHLNLDDEQAVIAVAKSFCVTPQELRDAVVTTGTDIAALEEHFQSQ